MNKELLQPALYAMGNIEDDHEVFAAISALREAIAQPVQLTKQEPPPAAKVIGKWIDYCDNIRTCIDVDLPMLTNLYTSPQQRNWVGLTDEEMKAIDPDGFAEGFPQKIIAALKEKNT